MLSVGIDAQKNFLSYIDRRIRTNNFPLLYFVFLDCILCCPRCHPMTKIDAPTDVYFCTTYNAVSRKVESRVFSRNLPITVPNVLGFILSNLNPPERLYATTLICNDIKVSSCADLRFWAVLIHCLIYPYPAKLTSAIRLPSGNKARTERQHLA